MKRKGAYAASVVVGLAVLGAQGCIAGTEGELGVFTFYDQTPPAQHEFPWDANRELTSPLAVGAVLDMRVTHRGFAFRPATVTLTPAGIATLEGIDSDGFRIRGNATGTVTVQVDGASGHDEIQVTVVQPTTRRIDLRPWNWYPLPSDYFLQGMAILVGQSGHVFGTASSLGTDLTGYGHARFSRTSAGDAIDVQPVAGSDFAKLTAMAEGTDTFAWGDSDPVTVAAVTVADVAAIDVVEIWRVQRGNAYQCDVGQTLYVVVVPYDAEGRMIVGTTDEEAPPTVTMDEASQVRLSDTTPTEPTDELRDVMQNRTVFLKCESAGSAEATLTWRGFSRNVTVTIAADAQ